MTRVMGEAEKKGKTDKNLQGWLGAPFIFGDGKQVAKEFLCWQ